MRWHEQPGVLGSRWELRDDERILAQAWQIRGDVYWKLGVFGSTRKAFTVEEAMTSAACAVVHGDAL